jgi:hypothetical protein
MTHAAPPRILPETIAPPPPMPTIEFGSSSVPETVPEPKTTPKKENEDTPEMITVPEQQPTIQPPQPAPILARPIQPMPAIQIQPIPSIQIPQSSSEQAQKVQEIQPHEVQTHDVGESGLTGQETPNQWKQFVVESVEGQSSREQTSFSSQPDVKMEFSDDTLEVIDCNSDSDGPSGTAMTTYHGSATGTDMVPIQPPHSSNGKLPSNPVTHRNKFAISLETFSFRITS